MPKLAKELSPLEVNRLVQPGIHAVGSVTGLCLQVTLTEEAKRASPSVLKAEHVARSWVLRVKVGDRRREFGIGSFPTVPLADARNRARALRDKVEAGIDPALERRAAKSALQAAAAAAVTFKDCAEAFIESKEAGWSNARYSAQVLSDMKRIAFPVIGKLIVRDVTTTHVLSVVEPIWKTKNPTAKKLRGNIERALNYATARGYREGPNPARWRGHLDQTLAAPNKVRKGENHPSLPVEQLPVFITELRTMAGTAARALEFTILAAARSGEVRGMTWAEVDLAAKRWNIPGTRMKNGLAHSVPLSERAVEILKAQPRPDDDQGEALVFPAPRSGSALSDMTLTAVIRRMNEQRRASERPAWVDPKQKGRDVVPHGFRSTFRIWAKVNKYDNDAAEAALAHSEENATIKAYLRTDYFEERVTMMVAWSTFCGKQLATE
jgi:integrase